MIVEKITYQKIFPTGMAYLNHKIGVEVQVEAGDNYDEVFKAAKALVEQWNIESNPSYALTMEYMKPSEQPVTYATYPLNVTSTSAKDERIQSFIATINYCTNKSQVERFRKRMEEEKNDELTTAFNNKLKSFE